MTAHDKDKIIAAAKEADSGFTGDESFNLGTSLVGLEAIEYFYAIAFAAGAAQRHAEIAKLRQAVLDYDKRWHEEQVKCDQLRKDVALLWDLLSAWVRTYPECAGEDDRKALAKVRKP